MSIFLKNGFGRLAMVVFFAFLTLLLLAIGIQPSAAEPLAADLSGSQLQVDLPQASPGATLQYTLVISNSGGLPADLTTAAVTNVLPAELAFVPGSLTPSAGIAGESGGVITWSVGILALGEQTLTYQAVLTDTVAPGQVITNSLTITGSNLSLSEPLVRLATTEVVENWVSYLPILFKAPPTPAAPAVSSLDGSGMWTVSWTDMHTADPAITGYELQEATKPDFSDAVSINLGLVTSTMRTPSASASNAYYYRLRTVSGSSASGWSSVTTAYVAYEDNFNDSSSGWVIVRQDTDDVQNRLFYTSDGLLNLEMDGRWDYMIASPKVQAPEPPYKYEARIRFSGPDNLHAYGLIFGADWDGISTCPVSNYVTCFNNYYRTLSIWSGDTNSYLTTQLKQINSHTSSTNAGRGIDLTNYANVPVSGASSGWQVWAAEVYPNGQINILVNNNPVFSVVDPTFVDNPYFGIFAATNEYAGLDVQVDWVRVSPIP